MAEQYDIAIVGAGPAGALAARLCAQRGASVLLVDKAHFPRAKVCGGCLGGEAVGVLERARLSTLPATCGAWPLHALRLAAAGRTADVSLAAGYAVSRQRFDHALTQAAVAAGVTFHDDTTATLAAPAEMGRNHQLALRRRAGSRAERSVRARVLLVADGIAGTCFGDQAGYAWRIARRARVGFGAVLADAGAGYPPGVICMAVGRFGYVGVVRVEEGQLDIAAAVDALALREAGGPAEAAARLLAEAGLPAVTGLADAGWRGTPWLTRERRRVAGHGLMLLGDATGYVEPFTGEGIGWALRSAEAVAPLAVACIAEPSLAGRWAQQHRGLFAARRRRCRLVSTLLRRPTLMRWTTALLHRQPQLVGPLTRRLAMGG